MVYTIKVKKVSGFFYKKYINIENDWLAIDYFPLVPKRTLVDKDKNCFEIDLIDNIVVISKERPIGEIRLSRVKFDVKYKKRKFGFWKTIKNCVVDTSMYEKTGNPIRVFITDTGERWEIPCNHYDFKFDKNKFLAIQDVMSQEAGQPIDAIK